MAFRVRAALLAVPALALAMSLSLGCDADDDSFRTLDLAELPERFACDDLTVVAASSDGHEALLIGVDAGLAAAATASGEVVEADYPLPDARLTVRWVEGSNVYDGQCGRYSPGQWSVDDRRDAISGSVHIRISPNPTGEGFSLTAELDGLVLASDAGGESYELDGHALADLALDP